MQSRTAAFIPSDRESEASSNTPELNQRRCRFMFNIYNTPLWCFAFFMYMLRTKSILRGIITESDHGTSSRTISWRTSNETQRLVTPIASSPTGRPTISPEASGETINEPEDAFDFSSSFWSSLDLNGEIKCGKYKCLFRQKIDHNGAVNVTGTGDVAFLVGSNCRRYQFELEMELSWKLAQYLRATHQIKHLFLEAPRRVMILPPAIDEIFNTKRLFKKSRRLCKTDATYVKWNFTIVQKVRLVSSPMFTIKKNTWKQFENFVNEKIANISLFVSTFREDFGPAMRAIESVPLLAHDFQILVDGKGNIFHFDIDRAFHAGLGGRLNDGRSYSSPRDFPVTFAQDYDESIDILRFLVTWSSNLTQKENIEFIIHDRQKGESVLLDYVRKSSSLSCKAVELVKEMSGRDEVTRDAALMMVHLVNTALLFHGDEPKESEDGMTNCSL